MEATIKCFVQSERVLKCSERFLFPRALKAAWLALAFCVLILFPNALIFADERPSVMVLRPEGEYFKQVFDGIYDGIDGEIELIDVTISKRTESKQIHKLLKATSPQGVIMMDNLGVLSYQRYQEKYKKSSFPPSIIVATLFAERVVHAIDNSTAILYEIPALTSLSDLRNTVRPVKRAGVLYRENLRHVFEANRKLVKLEGIELLGVSIGSDSRKRQVEKGVKKLLTQNLDVLWIMNDGNLLTPLLIKDVWIKRLKGFDRPVIVGIESLINGRLQFGDYAVSPDHYDLGQQASTLLLDIKENNWFLDDALKQPQRPIIINKSVNVKLLKNKNIIVPEAKLNEFDLVLYH